MKRKTSTIFIAMLLAVASARSAELSAAFRYYELRIYEVTSNKLDAVLERFHDTVEPLRRKHDIHTIGYWTAETTNGTRFIYLLAAPSREKLKEQEKTFGADPQFKEGYAASNRKYGKTVDRITTLPLVVPPEAKYDFTASNSPRAFDLRIYSVLPAKIEAFKTRWNNDAIPIYRKHGLNSVGWWTGEQKDPGGSPVFICLLAGENSAAIQNSIAAFHKDPDWQRVEMETERNGKLRSGVEAYKLTPTSFSALK